MALSITEDEENFEIFYVQFDEDVIETTVTCDPDSVVSWISTIEYIHHRRLHRLIVGLDIEWLPHTRYYTNPVAILQLCVGRRCLIFQLLYASSIPRSLADFLTSSCYTFTGVGIDDDIDKIWDDYGLWVENSVDLRGLAANELSNINLRNAGLKTLAGVVLGRVIDKPNWITRSRWDNMYLRFDQIMYACIDAFVSFEIGRWLNASLNY